MIAQFALRLICGMSLTWCVMPRSQVTSGFFRIQMLVTLGLSVLATLTIGRLTVGSEGATALLSESGARSLCVAIAIASFLGSVTWTLERRTAGAIYGGLVCFGSTVALVCASMTAEKMGTTLGLVTLLSDLSTATLLGGCMTTMLLGHWYLTAPTMVINPLKRLTIYFGIAAGIRFVLSVIAMLYWGQDALAGQSETIWLWLTLRWLAGVFGSIIVAGMTLRILRYNNTQAATGVLFVGVILTFLGELSATLLFAEIGVPL